MGTELIKIIKRKLTLNNNWFKEFIAVKKTPNFSIMYNPARNPLDKEGYSYHLVYNKFNTIEASANSFLLISAYLNEAESGYSEMIGEDAQAPSTDKVLN